MAINRKIRLQEQQIDSYMAERRMYENKIKELNKRIDECREVIYKHQCKCKHTYIGQPETMMGRGICEICGDNDY